MRAHDRACQKTAGIQHALSDVDKRLRIALLQGALIALRRNASSAVESFCEDLPIKLGEPALQMVTIHGFCEHQIFLVRVFLPAGVPGVGVGSISPSSY